MWASSQLQGGVFSGGSLRLSLPMFEISQQRPSAILWLKIGQKTCGSEIGVVLKTMLFHHLDDLFPSIVQPAYRTDRTILPDDNETFFRIISVLCTVALADCENGVFSKFIGLRKADLPFSHLLDSVALKTQGVWQRRRGNSSSGQFDFTRLTQRRQIVVNGIQSLLPFRRPRCPPGLTPAKPGHAGAGAVCSAAGGVDKVGQLLTGLPELHGTAGVVHPGLCFGQIPALILAHGALPGPLHLADLVPGVFFPAVLDVPGVELFKALLRPCRRCAQLREDGEKGVAAVPAAQPCSGAVAGGGFKLAADGVGCRDSTKRHTAGKICVSLRLMGQILCYTSDSDPMISQSRAVSGVLSEPPGCFMGDILLEKGTGKMILFYIAVFFAAFFGRLLKK